MLVVAVLLASLSFEAVDDATFIARAEHHAVLLHPTGFAVDDIRAEFEGANPHATAIATDPLPGKVNYFLGNDTTQWRTDLDRFARAGFRNVYPGIDVVYYGNRQQLEYDFIVASHARPDAIALRFDDARTLRLDPNGGLVVNDVLRLHKPIAHQRDRTIECGYRVAKNRVTFEIGEYDPDEALIIDPVLGYATYLGGSGADLANAIAVDAAGNAYVTGRTASATFPITSGAFRTTRPSGSFGDDIFITKLDSKGALVWSTYLGGQFTDQANAIAVDKDGNAYVTGLTTSGDFPVTPGSLKSTFSDDRSFVTKLNASGNALVYSTYLKGTSSSGSRAIAVDPAGNAYVTGLAISGFTSTSGVFQPNPKSNDAFIAKINATGSAFVYATYLGGSGFQDEGFGIAADAAGVAYVTGKTDSTDFPVTSNAFRTTAPGGGDAFVAAISASGSTLLYATYLGGRGEDRGNAIAVDSSGNAYVTGYTYASDFPTVSPVQPKCGCETSVGGGVQSDAFVTKISNTGSALLYSTFYGGGGPDRGFGIGVDSSGAICFGGTTDGISPSTFPLVDSMKASKGLLDDAFAVRLNTSGSAAVYSTFFGGQSTDFAATMTIDRAGNVYLAGNTNSSDMPTTDGAAQRTFAGGSDDVFVAKIGNTPLPAAPGPKRRSAKK